MPHPPAFLLFRGLYILYEQCELRKIVFDLLAEQKQKLPDGS